MSSDISWHLHLRVDHDGCKEGLTGWRAVMVNKRLSKKAMEMSGNDRRSCLRLALYSMVEEIVEEVCSE